MKMKQRACTSLVNVYKSYKSTAPFISQHAFLMCGYAYMMTLLVHQRKSIDPVHSHNNCVEDYVPKDKETFFANVASYLRPGGRFFLQVYAAQDEPMGKEIARVSPKFAAGK